MLLTCFSMFEIWFLMNLLWYFWFFQICRDSCVNFLFISYHISSSPPSFFVSCCLMSWWSMFLFWKNTSASKSVTQKFSCWSTGSCLSWLLCYLHPDFHLELWFSWNIQSAALLSVGLLYEGSAHPQTMQILLVLFHPLFSGLLCVLKYKCNWCICNSGKYIKCISTSSVGFCSEFKHWKLCLMFLVLLIQ